MSHTSQRLTELEAMIAAAEMNITLLTSVIKGREATGRDATGLQKLLQSTRHRLASLKTRRRKLVEELAYLNILEVQLLCPSSLSRLGFAGRLGWQGSWRRRCVG